MQFFELFRYNLKNEKLRKGLGLPLFEDVLEGVDIEDLKPNPHRCSCNNYPTISKSGDNYTARCQNEKCGHFVIEDDSSYQSIIFKWNLSEKIHIDIYSSKIHPLINISPSYDVIDNYFLETQKIEANLQLIETGTLAKKEVRLIKLIRLWNHFSLQALPGEVSSKILSSECRDSVGEMRLESEHLEKISQRVSSRKVSDLLDDVIISGPMEYRRSEIQKVGSCLYWFVSGNLVLLKECHKTGWLRPSYLVCIDFGNDDINYQLRIDLRSIGVEYISKLLRRNDTYTSLGDGIDILERQLRSFEYSRVKKSIIDRSLLANKKKFNISEVSNISLVKSNGHSNYGVQLTFPADNEVALARISGHIGGEYNLSYDLYVRECLRLTELSIAHASMSIDKQYSCGGIIEFSKLSSETQSAIASIVADEKSISISDSAYYLLYINPVVNIGYLPLVSLNNKCSLSTDSNLMQVVSYKNKAGYIEGELRRHDYLKNADCVCIDTILRSNFEEIVYDPSVKFLPGFSKVALMISLAALQSYKTRKISRKNLSVLSPYEFLHKIINMPDKVCNIPDLVQENQTPEFISYSKISDPNMIIYKVPLENWNNDMSVALMYARYSINRMLKTSKRRAALSNAPKDRFLTRYTALGLDRNALDLSNVSFVAGKASKNGIKSLYIKKNRTIKFIDKSKDKVIKKKDYGPLTSNDEFQLAVSDFFEIPVVKLNQDERALIKYVYESLIIERQSSL